LVSPETQGTPAPFRKRGPPARGKKTASSQHNNIGGKGEKIKSLRRRAQVRWIAAGKRKKGVRRKGGNLQNLNRRARRKPNSGEHLPSKKP